MDRIEAVTVVMTIRTTRGRGSGGNRRIEVRLCSVVVLSGVMKSRGNRR